MSSMRTSTFKQLISVRPSQVSLCQGSWQHSGSPVANSEQYPSNFSPFKFSLPFSFSYTRSSSTFFGISSSDLPIYSGESFISGNKDLNYSTGATRYYSSICRAKSSFSTEFLQKFIRLGEDPGFTHKPTLVEQGGGMLCGIVLVCSLDFGGSGKEPPTLFHCWTSDFLLYFIAYQASQMCEFLDHVNFVGSNIPGLLLQHDFC